jgi:hypothetical protein
MQNSRTRWHVWRGHIAMRKTMSAAQLEQIWIVSALPTTDFKPES